MINDIFTYILKYISTLEMTFNWSDFIQIVFLAGLLLFLYRKFIKNTSSEKFVKGLLILVCAWAVSEIMMRVDLKIIGMFLKSIVTLVSLSLIVIFQPELRRFLGFLGQVDFVTKIFNQNNKTEQKIDVVKELVESAKYLSKSHTGALIVFQSDLRNTYSDVGTKLNADLSTELLLTIFHPNTPLHDGAVVINGDKIISAGVLLPLTEDPKLSWKYGTRHRAAIGMTEVSDAACLVVSEETGDVSIAVDGALKKYEDLITLKADLEKILGYKEEVEEDKKEFKVGDYVKITGLNSHGEIVDIRRNEATVLTNGMKMKVKISKLEPMHKPQIKKATYKAHVESVSSRFPLELNLIGMRVEEGIAALDKYLDQAVVKHIKQVRIIHGMGTGALRTAVWKDLKKQPNVSKFNSAGPSEGGLGATIVILK